jgi:hypothetical protein
MADLVSRLYKQQGTTIRGMKPAEQLKAAGLDWRVVKEQQKYGHTMGVTRIASDATLYRSDNFKFLGNCSGGWTPYQNADFIRDFNEACETAGLIPERIGFLPRPRRSYPGGNIIFAAADIPAERGGILELSRGKEMIDAKLIVTNSLIPNFGIHGFAFLVRGVCSNGMVFRQEEVSFSKRHIEAHVKGKEQTVLGGIEEMIANFALQGEILDSLSSVRLTDAEIRELLVSAIGNKQKGWDKQTTQVREIYKLSRGAADHMKSSEGIDLAIAPHKNTAYGVLQAATAYTNHMMGDSQARLLNLWTSSTPAEKINSSLYDSLTLAYMPARLREQLQGRNQSQQTVGVSAGF